jgi:hypothetical protein
MQRRRSEKEGLYYLDIRAEKPNIRTERAVQCFQQRWPLTWSLFLSGINDWDISTIKEFSRWLPLAV